MLSFIQRFGKLDGLTGIFGRHITRQFVLMPEMIERGQRAQQNVKGKQDRGLAVSPLGHAGERTNPRSCNLGLTNGEWSLTYWCV